MLQNLSPKDNRRVAIFDRFVRNANHLLKKKSAKQINKIVDEQEGFIQWIKDSETRNRLLEASQLLRKTALDSLSNFDSVIKRLEKCKQALKWKSLQEITNYFDEIANDLSKIPDQRMRLLLKQNFEYWKSRRLDDFYVGSTKATLSWLIDDRSVLWETVEEVELFFSEIHSNIAKISNEKNKVALFYHAEFLRKDAIQMIELAS